MNKTCGKLVVLYRKLIIALYTENNRNFDLTFKFRAFSRCFYPKRLTNNYNCLKKVKHYIAVGVQRD